MTTPAPQNTQSQSRPRRVLREKKDDGPRYISSFRLSRNRND